MKDQLDAAINDLSSAPKVEIKGKQYSQVATRVEVFRKHFPDWGIVTEVLPAPDGLVRVKAAISNDSGVLATGHAEEDRNKGQINKTSALENCETSAIGRALAALGLHGGEFASGDEVAQAVHQQNGKSNARLQTGKLGITKLKQMGADFYKDLQACDDASTLDGLLNDPEFIEWSEQTMRDHPAMWYGKDDQLGMSQHIENKRADLRKMDPALREA